jgi:Methyltransferase domain
MEATNNQTQTTRFYREVLARYDKYVRNVGFRYYGPQSRLKGFRRLTDAAAKFNLTFEVLNTRLPEREAETKQRLRPLCEIPRMSTFAIGAIINHTVACMSGETSFVNIGVWNGFTLLSGMIGNPNKICIGVDNFSEFGGPRDQFLDRFNTYRSDNHHFYCAGYQEYFRKVHSGEIGFYIYDGHHSYEHQMAGLKLAEPFFAQNCVILVDDTNGIEPRDATLDFIRESPNRYEILLDVKTLWNKHPTFWNGVLIFRRR